VVGFGRAVTRHTCARILAGTALLSLLGWATTSCAQESSTPKPLAQPAPLQGAAGANGSAATCVQPPPMVTLDDYNGPLEKTVGLFTQQLERKSVHPLHYKSGVKLCSLELKDKFILFARGAYDPATIFSAGFNAGISQAQNQDRSFGQGGAGYGKRFAASYADQATSRFFKDFAYPTLFFEDPRYYRLGHGSAKARLVHAVEHAVVAHRDNGNEMFNFSEWLGTVSAISLSNVYHPGNERGFVPTAEGLGFSVLNDMGYDLLREFWPEISHKFKLPFRSEPAEPVASPTSSPPE
jgi:hypothetical protein